MNKSLMAVGIILCILLAGSAVYYFKNYSTGIDKTAELNGQKNQEDEDILAETPEIPAPPEGEPTSVWQVIRPLDQTDHILGSSDAELTIILYSDIECPYCKLFHATMKKVMENYGKNGDVRWVYRHYPIPQLHPTAQKEAEATECAAELGGNAKFWEYMDKLVDGISPSVENITNQLVSVAKIIGLNESEFRTCLESGKYAKRISESSSEAALLGAQGTPYSIVVNKEGKIAPIPGYLPYEDPERTSMKEIIESLLLEI